MGGHVLEHIPFPAKIFHELTWQFDRIPLDAADTGHIALVDLRQKVVQAMTEFMEQGGHIIVRQQCGFAIHTTGKVAHQMGHRRLQLVGVRAQPAGAYIIHPGAASFAISRGRVQVKLAHQFRCSIGFDAFDAVKTHRLMPHRGMVFPDGHFKEGFNDPEQARQYGGQRKILFDFLFVESVAFFLELFTDIGPVPWLWVSQVQMFERISPQVSQILFGKWPRPLGHVTQKIDHMLGRFGHFRYH